MWDFYLNVCVYLNEDGLSNNQDALSHLHVKKDCQRFYTNEGICIQILFGLMLLH